MKRNETRERRWEGERKQRYGRRSDGCGGRSWTRNESEREGGKSSLSRKSLVPYVKHTQGFPSCSLLSLLASNPNQAHPSLPSEIRELTATILLLHSSPGPPFPRQLRREGEVEGKRTKRTRDLTV